MVVEREDGVNILPLAGLWGDPCTSLAFWPGDEEVDQTEALRLGDGVVLERLRNIMFRAYDTCPLQPVSEARAVDLVVQDLVRGDPDEYQEGSPVAIPDLCGQADTDESFN